MPQFEIKMPNTAVSNPMLEDDDELTEATPEFVNPLLEEDDDEVIAPPVAKPAPVTPTKPSLYVAPSRNAIEAELVDELNAQHKADSKNAKPRKGTPRARVTEKDKPLLVHLAMFQVGNAELLSMLYRADHIPAFAGEVSSPPRFPLPRTITNRLVKLRKLELTTSVTYLGMSPVWMLTRKGMAYVFNNGWINEAAYLKTLKPAEAISQDGIPHRIAVSLVAAQLVSGVKEFHITHGLPEQKHHRYTHNDLVGETMMRSSQKVAEHAWKAAMGAGYSYTFPTHRLGSLQQAQQAIEAGHYSWSDAHEYYPELWAFGRDTTTMDANNGKYYSAQHFPDLAINHEALRTSETPVSDFIEIEINAKRADRYVTLMRTYAHELLVEKGIYKRCIYFTNNQQVVNHLRKADKLVGAKLEERGLLIIKPLLAPDGVTPWSHQKTVGTGTGVIK